MNQLANKLSKIFENSLPVQDRLSEKQEESYSTMPGYEKNQLAKKLSKIFENRQDKLAENSQLAKSLANLYQIPMKNKLMENREEIQDRLSGKQENTYATVPGNFEKNELTKKLTEIFENGIPIYDAPTDNQLAKKLKLFKNSSPKQDKLTNNKQLEKKLTKLFDNGIPIRDEPTDNLLAKKLEKIFKNSSPKQDKHTDKKQRAKKLTKLFENGIPIHDEPTNSNQLAKKLTEIFENSLPLQGKLTDKEDSFATIPGYSENNIEDRLADKKLGQFDKLFDENGMLFLTKPKYQVDRKINELMNKVIKYKLDSQDSQYMLRQPLTSVFNAEEIEQLKTIVDAVDNERVVDPVQAYEESLASAGLTIPADTERLTELVPSYEYFLRGGPKTTFDFNELVSRK